ncbi:MAG: hypothetical protein IBJ18_09530 [Phycisphaerales bacterium]|nr:hypothetical protein [Phycisphaerales bacterium]
MTNPTDQPAPDLRAQIHQAINQIHAAFKDVDRTNGISWREADIIDDHGDEYQLAAARARDNEKSWTDLLDPQRWPPTDGPRSGWAFLDPIGFRYYLPVAMIRHLRRQRPGTYDLVWILNRSDKHARTQMSLFTPPQWAATLAFTLICARIAQSESSPDTDSSEAIEWLEAHESLSRIAPR